MKNKYWLMFLGGVLLGVCTGASIERLDKRQTFKTGNTYEVDKHIPYSFTVYYYRKGKINDSVKNVTRFNIRTLYDCDSVVSVPTEITHYLNPNAVDILYTLRN